MKSFIHIVYLLSTAWFCALLVTLSPGCSSSDDDQIYGAQGNNTSMTIGAEGGVVEVTDISSAIYGAKVYIPPGALSEEKDISISNSTVPRLLPDGYCSVGECINFKPDGIEFLNPIMMYLPYVDSNNDGIVDGKAVVESNVGVLYYNESDGEWEWMDLNGTETDQNRAVIESEHFSTYLTFIDTSDSEPYDTGTAPDQTEDAAFESGDCYLEGLYNDDCPCYFLTITRRSSGLLALVDRNATYTTNGYPVTISESYDSATFDAASAFARVLESGDASLWQWEAEFVQEHTYLLDYEAEEDPLLTTAISTSGAATRIYCGIEAVDASMVRISWQINVNEQVVYPTSPQGNGHMLVIRFSASYQ